MENQEETISLDEYLRRSDRFLKFAKAQMKKEPEKARGMILDQLSEHVKLLTKVL